MQYGGKYWNIKNYLPYQRCFNFIDSERTIGKTYTAQGFMIERAITKGERFVYICRTQDELIGNLFQDAFDKVCSIEFPDYKFKFSKDKCFLKGEEIRDEKGKVIDTEEDTLLGYAVALSMATKLKKKNYPFVKWMLMDEYIVDEKEKKTYVTGWNEPNLFLKIYHTIDREQDNVICFLLANTIQFYNPYHLHKAFSIPKVEKGKIWYNDNVLYHQAEATAELKEDKAKSKFLNMIADTEYGSYAKDGYFVNDNYSFVVKRPDKTRYCFTIKYMGFSFGVWSMFGKELWFIDDKPDPSSKLVYSLTVDDHSENTVLTKGAKPFLLKALAEHFRMGRVRFSSMEIKAVAEEGLRLIL